MGCRVCVSQVGEFVTLKWWMCDPYKGLLRRMRDGLDAALHVIVIHPCALTRGMLFQIPSFGNKIVERLFCQVDWL